LYSAERNTTKHMPPKGVYHTSGADVWQVNEILRLSRDTLILDARRRDREAAAEQRREFRQAEAWDRRCAREAATAARTAAREAAAADAVRRAPDAAAAARALAALRRERRKPHDGVSFDLLEHMFQSREGDWHVFRRVVAEVTTIRAAESAAAAAAAIADANRRADMEFDMRVRMRAEAAFEREEAYFNRPCGRCGTDADECGCGDW
jgi:hypothetical protein